MIGRTTVDSNGEVMSIKFKLITFSTLLAAVCIGLTAMFFELKHRYLAILTADEWTGTGVSDFLARNYLVFIAILGIILVPIAVYSLAMLIKSVVSPLNSLNKALLDIRDGELDNKILYLENDEFIEIFAQLESMRVRLKDLLIEQVDNEEERIKLYSNIAHDFKTPITSIKGYAQGIIDGVPKTDEERNKYLSIIIDKAESLSKLSVILQENAEVSNKATIYDKHDISFLELVKDLINDSRRENKNVKFTLNSAIDSNTLVNIDPSAFERVFSNLVQNSEKYKKGDVANIDVNLYESKDRVVLRVSDDGMGVPIESLDKLFERFYRSSDARSSPEKGSGLGLSISMDIIKAMNGWIWARQNKPCGLAILISLPKV